MRCQAWRLTWDKTTFRLPAAGLPLGLARQGPGQPEAGEQAVLAEPRDRGDPAAGQREHDEAMGVPDRRGRVRPVVAERGLIVGPSRYQPGHLGLPLGPGLEELGDRGLALVLQG